MKIATSLAGRVLASTERHVSTQKSITRTAYGFASPVWDHDSLNDCKEPQQNLSACKCHSNRRESPQRFGWQYRNGQPHQRSIRRKNIPGESVTQRDRRLVIQLWHVEKQSIHFSMSGFARISKLLHSVFGISDFKNVG